MALATRGRGANRFSATIWPGFVDAMTALVMVMMFVLTIFMVVQSVLREQVTSQETQLEALGAQVAGLSAALAVSERESKDRQAALDAAGAQIADFETKVAALIAARDAQSARAQTAEALLARSEAALSAEEEANRLAAARRRALDALVADLRQRNAETGQALDEAEAARLADAAAAEALRQKLAASDAELSVLTLQLEEERARVEETLTLLAAAEAARDEIATTAEETGTEAERQAALLAVARDKLAAQEVASAQSQRQVAALNAQVAALNAQLADLQSVLGAGQDGKSAQALEIERLGADLNAALLEAAREKDRRLALEEAERARLEAEKADLARYRSEFFGRLNQILSGREGVQVVGDRFVFSSEVLFDAGEAVLSAPGKAQIAQVAELLGEIAVDIPPEIDWVIRVDGHTDDRPLSGNGRYRDNWELSQARALAVVRYLTQDLGFPAERLAATGFAEFRPAVEGDSDEARARNRRIELKLTER